jgi:hypothetical protein
VARKGLEFRSGLIYNSVDHTCGEGCLWNELFAVKFEVFREFIVFFTWENPQNAHFGGGGLWG